MTLKNFMLVVKRNVYLVISILVFASSLAFAATTIGLLGVGNQNEGTSVGYIYLGGLDESEYQTVLVSKVASWKADAHYQVKFQGYTHEINLNRFLFDVSTTLSMLESGEKNQAYFTISENNRNNLIDELEATFTNTIINGLNFESFISHVFSDLGNLTTYKTYQLDDFLPDTLPTRPMNTAIITNLSNENFDALTGETVLTLIIQPKTRFSLLNTYQDTLYTNEQLSIIASGLQKLLRDSPMTNFIFNENPVLPAWAELGMNVRILRVNQYDFTFYNPLDYAVIVFVFPEDNNQLRFTLSTYPFLSSYTTSTVLLTSVPFQEINLEDDTVDENTLGVEIWDETDEEITYRVLISSGSNGSISAYVRTETFLSGDTEVIRLYEEETLPIPAVYHYYTYSKVGD